jgi:hypothetical protein
MMRERDWSAMPAASAREATAPLPRVETPELQRPAWAVSDLPFERLDRSRVRDDETLFYLLVCASFIESGSDLYTANLIEHYRELPHIARWLHEGWQHDELRHGMALERYVRSVWPEYPWSDAFQAFFTDYRRACSAAELESDRALELAARCVIEMGTASFYRMLYEAADEPVLRQLLDYIRRDEVRHYKYFFAFWREARQERHISRFALARCMIRRTLEMTNDDGWYAFRQAYSFRQEGRVPTRATYRQWRKNVRAIAARHFPGRMAAEMMLAPLALTPRWRESAVALAARAIRLTL